MTPPNTTPGRRPVPRATRSTTTCPACPASARSSGARSGWRRTAPPRWPPTPDGNVHVTNDTADLYRYYDATRQAEYLADCIECTVRIALPAGLQFLHRFDDAKRRIAELADMPDRLVSLFIQLCVQNGGRLSARKQADFFPGLPDDLVSRLEHAVGASGIVNPSTQTPAAP